MERNNDLIINEKLKNYSSLEILDELNRRMPDLIFYGKEIKNNISEGVYRVNGDNLVCAGILEKGNFILSNKKD